MKTYRIDGAAVTDIQSFYEQSAKVFSFPEHFGKNLDAFADCISEFQWETVVLGAFDALEEKLGQETLGQLMEIFSDADIEVVLEYWF